MSRPETAAPSPSEPPGPTPPGAGAMQSLQPLQSLQSLIDHDTHAILIIDATTLGYLAVNAAACELLGHSRLGLLASGAATASAESGLTAQPLREHYAELIRRAPAPFACRSFYIHADGNAVEVDVVRRAFQLEGRWAIHVRARALGAAASPDVSSGGDLSRVRSLMGHNPDPMILVDHRSLRYLDANDAACALLGYSRSELIGANPQLAGGPPAAELKVLYGRLVLNSPQAVTQELTLVRKGGAPVEVQVTRYALMTDGRWVIFVTLRDLTPHRAAERELKRHMEELTRSNQELERFAYVASHDLSEPLRMVASYTQLLARRYGDRLDQDARDFIGFAVDGARRMQHLIDDLLTYSRAGRNDRARQATDMNDVLHDAIDNLRQLVQDTGATFQVPRLPVVHGDHTSLTQLLQNLIGNALKFVVGRPPRVRITAEEGDEDWTFCVSDNGVGIEARYHQRIFEIFQRLHPQDRFRGTGMGLAICKKIIDRHGGRIWVASRPGEGSDFFFTLPKSPPPDTQPNTFPGAL